MVLRNCKVITFEKNTNNTKCKQPNVPSHLRIFCLNFDKENQSFLHLFLQLGETDFRKKCCLGEWVLSLYLGSDNNNLQARFEWGGEVAWVKMPQFNAVSRNVHIINLKSFPTHGGLFKFWKNSTNVLDREIWNPKEFIEIRKDVSLKLILKDKGGNQYSLPFC